MDRLEADLTIFVPKLVVGLLEVEGDVALEDAVLILTLSYM